MSTKKSSGNSRGHTVSMRLTDAEWKMLQEQSEIAGLSTSEYCRRRVFGKVITAILPQTDREAIATLRQLGGLLKQVYKSEVVDESATYAVLKKINLAVDEIRRGVRGES